MRWSTPSSAAICSICATNSAICCSRWCSTRGWPRSKARSISADVVEAITSKLVRRHPHVFGTARGLEPAQVKAIWDEIKQAERKPNEGSTVPPPGSRDSADDAFLSGIPAALPALTRAQKLTARAAKVGFDWPDSGQVIDKIHEELHEVAEAAATGDPDRIEDEIGDLLFAATNLARHYGVDPEAALRRTNAKFERRFGAIETALKAERRSLQDASLDEMERLWVDAKSHEKSAEGR